MFWPISGAKKNCAKSVIVALQECHMAQFEVNMAHRVYALKTKVILSRAGKTCLVSFQGNTTAGAKSFVKNTEKAGQALRLSY